MDFIKDVKEIRRELSYAVQHHKDAHYKTVLAVMLQVRHLVERTLNHLHERSQEDGKTESRDTRAETRESQD